MRTFKTALVAGMACAGFMATSALAHDWAVTGTSGTAGDVIKTSNVVPEAETERAQELLANGPKKHNGIAAVNVVGSISLDGEFVGSDGLMIRVREININPGGVVAVHQHTNRPGAAYIIEGEMTEHRSGQDAPNILGPGSTAMERSGVIHWWENTGTTLAKTLVVDIVPAE